MSASRNLLQDRFGCAIRWQWEFLISLFSPQRFSRGNFEGGMKQCGVRAGRGTDKRLDYGSVCARARVCGSVFALLRSFDRCGRMFMSLTEAHKGWKICCRASEDTHVHKLNIFNDFFLVFVVENWLFIKLFFGEFPQLSTLYVAIS